MMNAQRSANRAFAGIVVALATCAALSASLAQADPGNPGPDNRYARRNLVSDLAGAENRDPNLVNAWGIAFNPFAFVWVADNETGVSTLYDGDGHPQALIVTIPAAAGAAAGNPTGIVFNGSSGFVVKKNGVQGASAFLFATEDGVIAGWNPNVDLTHAILAVDNSSSGAVYKGLALSAGGNGQMLYATDFHNNKIDVWDASFMPVTLSAGAFTDPEIPHDFGPFGIQAINGNIYVTYAKADADRHDDVKGKGLGYVDVYDPNGKLIDRVIRKGQLNAPWGIALAPAGFGGLANTLLVGNFGDGRINAYDLATGKHVDELKGTDGKPIVIDGLWGIAFGNGSKNQPVNTLFFAAGPNDEEHGLYGRLDPAPREDHKGR
jgi:uncharacterized protein (TIGR03118 family)